MSAASLEPSSAASLAGVSAASLAGSIGITRDNALPITPQAHIRQAVMDVLTTPIGTRIQRRWYGSHLAALVDSPGHARGRMRLLAAAADALARCEPRVRMRSGRVGVAADGRARLTVAIEIVATGEMTEISL